MKKTFKSQVDSLNKDDKSIILDSIENSKNLETKNSKQKKKRKKDGNVESIQNTLKDK